MKPDERLFERSSDRVKKLYKASKKLKRDKDRKEWKAKHGKL